VRLDKFVKDGDLIELELQGHQTLYPSKGKNGKLTVKVNVSTESERWRAGNDVHTVHFITLGQMLGEVSKQSRLSELESKIVNPDDWRSCSTSGA
jgi:hypothetical protein